MASIICNTKFTLDPFADGGSKRSVQIREILSRNSLSFVEDGFILPKNVPLATLFRWACRSVAFIHRCYPKKEIKSLNHYIKLVKYFALRIPVIYDKYVNTDSVFCWENTNDKDIVYLMKATKCPVIALPHNIESLVNNYSSASFNREMDALCQCDAVFAISKEETWLLRLLGMNAHYLPYFPPKEAEEFLKSIRTKRENRVTNGVRRFLLLGSATNTPTRQGMQTLIDQIPSNSEYEFYVAGYGTESLDCAGRNVIFLGPLSNQKLEELLVDIDALLIYQPPTTGSLTRIPEMLIAGIPIFANVDAARNFFDVKDVTIYHSFEELSKLLSCFVPYMPDLPLMCQADSSEFVNALSRS